MNSRGEYRPIHTVLPDGADFQRLSPNARLTLYTLKLSLGATGIDVLYTGTIEERTGLDRDQCRAALDELVDAEWLKVDGNIMWLVRGFEFEPGLSPLNDNHRAAISKRLRDLPNRPILRSFREHYPQWFPQDTNGTPKPRRRRTKTPDVPSPKPSDSHGEGIPYPIRITDTDTDTDTDKEKASADADAKEKNAAAAAPEVNDQPLTANTSVPWPIRHSEPDWPEASRSSLRLLSLHVHPHSWPTWRAEIDAMLDGMPGHVQGKPFSTEEIAKAVDDFVANGMTERPNISAFRGYVRNARKAIESERARAEQVANDALKREGGATRRHDQSDLPRPPTAEEIERGVALLREARESAKRRDPNRAA